jgi:hypothetical protein
MTIIVLIQQINIDEKIKNAADNGYLIGICCSGRTGLAYVSQS